MTIFQSVEGNLDNNVARLTVSLQLQITEQSNVRATIKDISSTCRDPHLYFVQIGGKLGLIPELIVQRAFVSLWVQENEGLFTDIVALIKKELAVGVE